MASKTPIEARVVAHFGTCDPVEAQRLFATVRGVMAARKLLGRGVLKAKTTVARATVKAVAPPVVASSTQEA